MNEKRVSIVVPAYNEAESIPKLLEEIEQALTAYPYEVVLVDDGSTDNTYAMAKAQLPLHPNLCVVHLRRNLGKAAALAAGFEQASGDIVVTMDADLQDVPTEIPNLLTKLEQGYDLVSGWKQNRQDPIAKTLPSRLFNWVVARVSGIPLHDFNCGLKAYRADVVKHIDVYGERHRFMPILAKNAGFPAITELPVQHRPRQFGSSKYGWERFGKGFVDLMTVVFLSRYSRRPGHLFGLAGMVMLAIGMLITLFLTVERLLGYTALGNRPALWFGMMLIGVGIQLMTTGLLAELILAVSGQTTAPPDADILTASTDEHG